MRYQFNTYNLKQSTFQYKWQTSQTGFHSGLNLDSMWDAWKADANGRFYITDTQQSDPIVLMAGINHPTQGLYLSEAYAVPEQECWAFVGCSIETEKSTSHFQIGEDMRLDVLPEHGRRLPQPHAQRQRLGASPGARAGICPSRPFTTRTVTAWP